MTDDEQENGQQQPANAKVEPNVGVMKLKLLRLPKRENYSEDLLLGEARDGSEDVGKADGLKSEKRNAARFQNEHGPRSPLRPLRFDHNVENANLMLLGRKSGKIPMKSRRYEYNPSIRNVEWIAKERTTEPHPELVVARAVAVQTSTECKPDEAQVSTEIEPQALLTGILPDTPRTNDFAQVPAPTIPSDDSHQADKAVGVQCHLLNAVPTHFAAKKQVTPFFGGRFPIWIDLNTMTFSHDISEPQRYLLVAPFQGNCVDYSQDHTLIPRVLITHDDTNEAAGDLEETMISSADAGTEDREQPLDTTYTKQKDLAAHRETYRAHYSATANNGLRGITSAEDSVDALKEAKKDMDSMKQRILDLEACADTIDYEFKLAYQVKLIGLQVDLCALLGSY